MPLPLPLTRQLGDSDNPNEVVLTWKRTNTGYFDTLQDCCHVYTYGVDVLKQFSDGKGDLANVHFLLHNDTDGYLCDGRAEWTACTMSPASPSKKAEQGHVFVPNGERAHHRVMGLEDDTYTLTETATDKGYVLLKDGIEIVITAAEGESGLRDLRRKAPDGQRQRQRRRGGHGGRQCHRAADGHQQPRL